MSFAQSSDQDWDKRSQAWTANADWIGEGTRSVTDWLVAAVRHQVGDHVLELASGTGDPGLALAAALGEEVRVTITDRSPDMLAAVRERVAAASLPNVTVREMTMEAVDLPDGSVHAIVCRLGFMLSPDIPRALGEAYRVLVPGGRLALAVWGDKESNPLFTVPAGVLKRLDLAGEAPPPGSPGPLRLADHDELTGLLEAAGFATVVTEDVEVAFAFPSAAAVVDALGGLRPALKSLFAELPKERVAELKAALAAGFDACAEHLPGGSISVPGAMLAATADSRS